MTVAPPTPASQPKPRQPCHKNPATRGVPSAGGLWLGAGMTSLDRPAPVRVGAVRRLYSVTVFIVLASLDNVAIGLVPPLYTPIGRALHQPESLVSLVTAISFLVTAVAAVGWAYVGDRTNRKPLLMIGTLVWSAGTGATALSGSFPAFLAAQILASIGLGAVASVGFSVVSDLISPRRRGLVMSLWGLSQGVGTLAGTLIGGLLGAADWRRPFLLLTAMGIAATLAYTLTYDIRRGQSEPDLAPLFEAGGEYEHRIGTRDMPGIAGRRSNVWLILQGLTAQMAFGSDRNRTWRRCSRLAASTSTGSARATCPASPAGARTSGSSCKGSPRRWRSVQIGTGPGAAVRGWRRVRAPDQHARPARHRRPALERLAHPARAHRADGVRFAGLAAAAVPGQGRGPGLRRTHRHQGGLHLRRAVPARWGALHRRRADRRPAATAYRPRARAGRGVRHPRRDPAVHRAVLRPAAHRHPGGRQRGPGGAQQRADRADRGGQLRGGAAGARAHLGQLAELVRAHRRRQPARASRHGVQRRQPRQRRGPGAGQRHGRGGVPGACQPVPATDQLRGGARRVPALLHSHRHHVLPGIPHDARRHRHRAYHAARPCRSRLTRAGRTGGDPGRSTVDGVYHSSCVPRCPGNGLPANTFIICEEACCVRSPGGDGASLTPREPTTPNIRGAVCVFEGRSRAACWQP